MQVPGALKPGGVLRRHSVHDSQAALRNSRRGMFAALGVLAAGEVAATVVAPPIGAVLLGSTGAAVFLGRRTEQLTAEEHRRELARSADQRGDAGLVDPETGLPNRQHLLEQLGREVARAERYGQPMTLSVIEIERLAELEHAWGPATTEKAVAHVAETLKRVVRSSDFLARLDDRRFAAVLVNCSEQQAAAFGERVMLAVSNRPLQARERGRLPVYVSVGISALAYEGAKYRGPLDFLSAAGGEINTSTPRVRTSPPKPAAAREPAAVAVAAAPAPTAARFDPHALRRQLVRDYYPDGKADDFATAYGKFRRRNAS
ncbi:MAG: GGDEF domain-containing protein [Hyphomicrobiales bacterium]